jgi:hypothetical protein
MKDAVVHTNTSALSAGQGAGLQGIAVLDGLECWAISTASGT